MDVMQKKDEEQFMVMKEGRQFGPYPKSSLLENISMNNFTLDDPVWNPSMKNWEPAHYHVTREEREVWRIGSEAVPNSPKDNAMTLEKLLDLSPIISTLAIIVDLMVFILSIPTLGLIIFAVVLLGVITYLVQKYECGDEESLAIRKTLTVVLLTGIPVPICTALILYYKVFGKKKAAVA